MHAPLCADAHMVYRVAGTGQGELPNLCFYVQESVAVMLVARRTLVAIVAMLALAFPACVLAADSSVEGYGGPGGSVESSVTTPNSGTGSSAPALRAPSSDSGSKLPFTGLDVGFVAAVGLGLLLMGVGLSVLLRGRGSPALATAAPSSLGQSLPPSRPAADDGAALSVAMEMMIDGNTREEVTAYLSEVFRIENADALADEAFRRSQTRGRSALAMNVDRRLGRDS
jgi:hypothetical protein